MISHKRANVELKPENAAELAAIDRVVDHIMTGEEEIVPSSGFAAAVVERVREEAAAPRPIPFPWKRMLPGFALAAGVFGWGTYEFVRSATTAARSFATVPLAISPAAVPALESAGWVALALAASLLSWLLSRRLAGGSGLL